MVKIMCPPPPPETSFKHMFQVYQLPILYADAQSKEDSFIVKIFKCFSVNINGRAVLNTDAGGEGHITCLNGLRQLII